MYSTKCNLQHRSDGKFKIMHFFRNNYAIVWYLIYVIIDRWNKSDVKYQIRWLWQWFHIIARFKTIFRWAIRKSFRYSVQTRWLDQYIFLLSFEQKSSSIAVEWVFRLVVSKTSGEEFILDSVCLHLDSACIHLLITTNTNKPMTSIIRSVRRIFETRDCKTEVQCIWKHIKIVELQTNKLS